MKIILCINALDANQRISTLYLKLNMDFMNGFYAKNVLPHFIIGL